MGEYIGEGRGDIKDDDNDIYADLEDEHQQNLGGGSDEAGDSPVIGDSRPLLVLFDCETTGLSIYVDHITDIAAKVMNPPITLNDPTFSSLVRTGRNISSAGNNVQIFN